MKKLALAAFIAASLGSTQTFAQDLSITITNLTHGMAFTPALVAMHDTNGNLFDEGVAASSALQAMAEGGNLTLLNSDLDSISATRANATGPLMAGKSVSFSLNTDATPQNTKLSVVAMLLPTNDAFMGIDSIDIPSEPGTYTIEVNAYDAGTEANDELLNPGAGGTPGVAGMPGDPGGHAGTGATGGVAGADENKTVHIHRGAIGDSNPSGGNSDMVNTIHRWLNPVASVTVVVK